MTIVRQRFANLVADSLVVEKALQISGAMSFEGVPLWSTLDRDAQVFYQDPVAGGANNVGSRDAPVLTMTQALALCTAGRGDVIVRMRGGEEITETTLFNVAGVTVVPVPAGLSPAFNGEYSSMYAAVGFTDGPVAKISERTTIIGMGFASRDAGALFFSGAALLIGGDADATPYGVHLLKCRFPKWGFDNRMGIGVEGSTDCLIEECYFEGVTSAFDIGVYVQGATQNLEIRDCRFRQCTYAIQHGSFAGGGPHCLYIRNTVEDGRLLSATTAATGLVTGNYLETAKGVASFSGNHTTLNNLGLYTSGNHYLEVD